MKDDINLFNDNLKDQEINYIAEELELDDLEKKYEIAKNNIKKNNRKRIKAISLIRKNKLEEINEELKKSKIELKDLKDTIKNIIKKYCEINGHEDIIINRHIAINPETYDYCDDHGYYMSVTYKCKNCGKIHKEDAYGDLKDYPIKKCENMISSELYNDSASGKSIKDIEEEIRQLENYINYLLYLRKKICELFGHDAKYIKSDEIGKGLFKCDCCGARMGHKEYIKAHYNAKYKGIVSYYYEDSKDTPVHLINLKKLPDNLMVLPSYEEYNKKLVLKQEKKDKN